MLEHVPRDVTLTVTASPVKGLDHTLELAGKLAAHGYPVVPHLSARLVVDRAHLAELVARMSELGVRDVFVVAGDADQPAGSFSGAARAPRRDGRARPPVRADRDHRLPGEPSAHRRRDDDRGDVREGAPRDLHREPDLLRLARHRGAGSTTSGRAGRGCRSSSASPASSRARSCCASRRGSGSASRSATCASTATS